MILEELIKDAIWVIIMTAIFVIFYAKKNKWRAAIFYLFLFVAIKVAVNLLFK